MSVDVNWLAIVLATLSSMLIGSIWYGGAGFGKMWGKLTKIDLKRMKTDAAMTMGIAIISSLIMAYVLAYFTFLSHRFFQNPFLQDALMTALWMWFGFQAIRVVMHDAFEQRRKKLTLLNMGNDFVTIMVMGLIIGLIHH
jgi:uncharacterized membrane protein